MGIPNIAISATIHVFGRRGRLNRLAAISHRFNPREALASLKRSPTNVYHAAKIGVPALESLCLVSV